MKRRPGARFLIIPIVFTIALLPVAALAQDMRGDDEGLLLRVNGPVTVAEGETVDNVIVIGDDATVDGTVTGTLLVINGDASVTGQIGQDVAVIRGALDLQSTAQVDNVSVIRGELNQDPDATVSGSVTEGDFQVSPWDWGIFWAFMWAGITLFILVAGLVFAAIGGRQVKAAGRAVTDRIGATILGAATAWIILPIAMVLALFTLVAIPLSFGYFMFVLPILWFLGYLVAGTLLGLLIIRSQRDAEHPYLAALLGLIILQLIAILPILGGLIALLAGIIGSGGLIVLAWHAWRGPRREPEPADAHGGVSAPAG